MSDNKWIATIVAVVVMVAGVGAGIMFNHNSDNGSSVMTHKGRLMILGNANNDDTIDGEDISTLNGIISAGGWDKDVCPYADANNDGKIDPTDVDVVNQMISKEVTSLNYVNCNGDIKSVRYPVNDIVVVGTYAANGVVELGLCEKTVGISGSKHWQNSDYWGDLKDVPQISTGSIYADFELISELDSVDIIVTTESGVENEPDFNAAGIDVVRLNFGDDDEISALLMLGYMTGMRERARRLASFYDEIYGKAAELNKKLSDSEKKTVLVLYSQKWVYSDGAKHGRIAGKCAAINRYHCNDRKGNCYRKMLGGDEWILNGEWQSHCILGQEKWLYASDVVDVTETWKAYASYYSGMDAFPENLVLVNDSMAEPVKMAYIMASLYPDEFEEGYGEKMHQRFINDFVDCLSGAYDVGTEGSFFVTYDDIRGEL